jgi:hypothetical protein
MSLMVNNRLHTSQGPGMNYSSHLKHKPLVRQSTILVDENFVMANDFAEGDGWTEPIDVAIEVGGVKGLNVTRMEDLTGGVANLGTTNCYL